VHLFNIELPAHVVKVLKQQQQMYEPQTSVHHN